jgi:hypothetical protein
LFCPLPAPDPLNTKSNALEISATRSGRHNVFAKFVPYTDRGGGCYEQKPFLVLTKKKVSKELRIPYTVFTVLCCERSTFFLRVADIFL